MHPCVLVGNSLCRSTELPFFESLAEQADACAIKPDSFQQGAWAIGKQIKCTLGKAVLFVDRNETLQTEHSETHIHGLLVEDGNGVVGECEHITPLYFTPLQGFWLSAYDLSGS